MKTKQFSKRIEGWNKKLLEINELNAKVADVTKELHDEFQKIYEFLRGPEEEE